MVKNMEEAVFVNLSASYGTVCHCGFSNKLLLLLPDKRIVCVIKELVIKRNFTQSSDSKKRSRLRRLKKRYPSGISGPALIQHPYS